MNSWFGYFPSYSQSRI